MRRIDWNDALLSKMRRLIEVDGLIAAVVASELGVSRGTVLEKARSEGIALKGARPGQKTRPAVNEFWTEGDIDKLKALVSEGFGTSEIACQMGKTKGQIAGKIHRIGIASNTQPNERRVRTKRDTIDGVRAPKLPRLEYRRPDYMPTGRTPVRFLATGEYVCKVFLPGEPLGPDGLVRGNPTDPASGYRFCPACRGAMFSAEQAVTGKAFAQHDRSMARVG